MTIVEAVRWSEDGRALRIVDQTRLPADLVHLDLRDVDAVCEAIRTLRVRGAPALGIAAAFGLVVALLKHADDSPARFRWRAASLAERIGGTRPTAVNLRWALRRQLARLERERGDVPALLAALRDEADAIAAEDRAMCRRIGEHGLALVPDGARVLTHCNAGALATGGIGTALAPLYVAVEQGRRVSLFVDETRPLLQGSRLTAWEASRAGIPVTVLADNMAASLMARGEVDLVIVGADRIAANGDVANKIGTLTLAIVARHFAVPFYVAAPTSTLDVTVPDGAAIPIEQRDAAEVTSLAGTRIAPADVSVYNPAFDVTPAVLVSAIVTDAGVLRPPYDLARATRA